MFAIEFSLNIFLVLLSVIAAKRSFKYDDI